MDHTKPWLKYVEASALDDQEIDFDGMKVESPTGEAFGEIEGFIVDSRSGRPYYLVVDAGGWFKSKHFLMPVGHATLDASNEVLRTDLSHQHVERFPGFDLSKFDELTPAELKRLNDETLRVCEVSETVYSYAPTEPYSSAWDLRDFRSPDWWSATTPSPSRSVPRADVTRSSESFDRSTPDRETVVAHGDPSPHFAGRAQPGDVVGIETEGETTGIGDTAEDENKRREAAEKAVREDRSKR